MESQNNQNDQDNTVPIRGDMSEPVLMSTQPTAEAAPVAAPVATPVVESVVGVFSAPAPAPAPAPTPAPAPAPTQTQLAKDDGSKKMKAAFVYSIISMIYAFFAPAIIILLSVMGVMGAVFGAGAISAGINSTTIVMILILVALFIGGYIPLVVGIVCSSKTLKYYSARGDKTKKIVSIIAIVIDSIAIVVPLLVVIRIL